MSKINNRYDFLYIFDVQDGNPNGVPTPAIFPVWTRRQAKVW